MTFLTKQLPRAHVEHMRGRVQDNRKSCEKDGTLIEWGQLPDQGRRTHIIGLKRKLEQGYHPLDLAIDSEEIC